MDDTIERVNIQTSELQLETIQKVLQKARTCQSAQNDSKAAEMLELLWAHIENGLNKFDDQLLCSICFYTVLESTDAKEYYLEKLSHLVKLELDLRHQQIYVNNDCISNSVKSSNHNFLEKNKMRTQQVVSLMYGMLQSTFLTSLGHEINIVSDTIKLILDLLIIMAYEYSKYTFIVFKTISSLKKVCGTELQVIVFNASNILMLLNLVNHNWENPITGVRDINKSIFQILVSLFDENTREVVLKEINDFYWNKAKYLMLSEIIEQSKENLVTLVHTNYWICGLIDSLYKPGLVSAGADMYYAIVKNLKTEEEWCDIFKDRVLKILNGNSNKAIQNFSNYWCLATFKKFPDISRVLIEELEKFEESELQLYSSLCIVKQANKLGIAHKRLYPNDSITENMVLERLQHHNPHIRMLQFEIITVTQGKTLPSSLVYTQILEYLHNNVNSDCVVLRISMLGNIKSFLTYLHASYCNYKKSHQSLETQILLNFYRSLQEFLIESLNVDGNYQRKITTIKICSILLTSLNEIPRKRQKQTSTSGRAMTKLLKQEKCLILFEELVLMKLFSLLKDPADDIRDSTAQLLLDHYSQDITPTLLNYLIEDAQDCIRSKFFYQISCGQSIFKLITSLLLKEKFTDTIFKTANDVFIFAYGVLEADNEVERDIVKSIEDGRQLHAYLTILLEVLKVVKQNSYEIKDFKNNMSQLLIILEDISNQFAWEQEPATSSDFSKMSAMVKSIIASSGLNPLDENDVTKISGLEQIVLNCLWLNVKASCDLASYLTHFFKDDEDVSSCEKCLTIITHVLETSRHKGAIEAAGAALGRAIQYLTSLPEESALSDLPLTLLRNKLNELISHTNMASVTRRGAGLSIMVHRIVSSDMKKGKPLFHHFMRAVLRACAAPHSASAAGRDEAGALHVHFLARAVADSALAADLMHYAAALAERAFDNLTSTHWQIRNAALQLYGALIPKLIGQKKASGADETVATVAVDELRTHSPKLWRHALHCLTNIDDQNKVEAHSNVVPILNLLANLARRYNFRSDKTKDSEQELLRSLILLLDSPIYTVRRLTARCIFNIFDFETVHDVIMEREIETENFLHGSLLLLGNYKECTTMPDLDKFDELKEKYSKCLGHGNHSYFSRLQFEEQWSCAMDVEAIIEETKHNRYSPGVFYWANSKLKKYINESPSDDIPGILKILLQEDNYEYYCELVLAKMETTSSTSNETFAQVGKILLAFNNKFESCVVWKILYHITTHIDLDDLTDIESIFNYLNASGIKYRSRYILPFLASVSAKLPEKHLLSLSSIIFSLCDPDTSDVDMRYIASLANNEIAKAFPKITDSLRISAIKTAVILLQDEDEDVRLLNIKFYSNIKRNHTLLHPYICWNKILERKQLSMVLDNPETGIQIIYDDMTKIISNYAKSEQIDEYNPFANDSKNIYFEAEVLKNKLQELKDLIE